AFPMTRSGSEPSSGRMRRPRAGGRSREKRCEASKRRSAMTRTERIVLRGGRLAESGAVADIVIEDGRIAEIASREPGSTPRLSGDRTIDAEGLVVFPGLIDLQVNDIEWLAGGLRDPETHAERVRAVCRHHA